MPRRYKPIEDCRSEIREYARRMDAGTDDADDELRDEWSTRRYKQDLRWFDEWLDEQEIDSVGDVTNDHALDLGDTLQDEFNGTTPLYRWDRIHAFYDRMAKRGHIQKNPLAAWNDEKKQVFGMSKKTEQSRQIDEGETYAVSQSEMRQMEQHVGRHRIRDQLLIRMLWQTGIRRQEASELTLDMVNREARELHLPSEITKNDKPRHVAYQESLNGLLREWLNEGYRDEYAAGTDHDYVFVSERGKQLQPERINQVVKEAAKRAGLNRKLDYTDANGGERWLITAHNIRYGFGNYLVHETDAGLWEISQQMGHQSVEITEQRYIEDKPRSGINHTHQYGPE